MNLFETKLRDLLIAGSITGPVFIHSAHGVAILNATETGLAAILQAHSQAQATPVVANGTTVTGKSATSTVVGG